MKTVAALCVHDRSFYHSMSDVDAYDASRNAATFRGGLPIVAHPPCRLWSKTCRHFVKLSESEAEQERRLGLWCGGQLRKWGGVLEQPAGSLLFDAAGFPVPGEYGISQAGAVWCVEVPQYWWGFPTPKYSWLAFVGVRPGEVEWPFRLFPAGRVGNCEKMSRRQRAETTPEFARWLVRVAAGARVWPH